jgi:hypothetical protein
MNLKVLFSKISGYIILISLTYIIFHYLELKYIFISSTTRDSVSPLFSAFTILFSIISGFVIQSKWESWNQLTDATHGEISSLKQLFVLTNHFPTPIRVDLRKHIAAYLKLIINEKIDNKNLYFRSDDIERAIYELEETVLDINYSEHPNIGVLSFDLVRNCLEYREKRLQTLSHKLPIGVRVFILSTMFAIVLSSLLLYFDNVVIEYILVLFIGILSFGIYLLIDDLDNPYRPGLWYLSKKDYEALYLEIKDSINKKSISHPSI